MPWVRACLVWIVLAAAMVAHGTARERLLTPRLGEHRAHRVGCLTGSLVVLAVTWAALPWMGLVGAPRRQLEVGALWLVLTVVFELVFGRRVAGHSWSRLLRDYDLRRGRLWPAVLLVTLLAPRIAGWLRGGGAA